MLTSLEQNDLPGLGIARPLADQVVALARMGRDAGLDGVVASAHEIRAIKKACGEKFLVVTPGIRPAGAATGDQKRIMTPARAIAAGADYLVVGRPITEAADPKAAADAIQMEIKQASS